MPRPKPAAPKGKEKRQAIQKDKVDVRESTRAKVDELLAQPLSAFVMFGFAQRNLLKKQKPNATPKEVVKAIGACSCRLARDARDHALMRAQAIAGSSWPRRSDKSTRSSVNSPAAPPPRLALGPLLSTGPRLPQLPRMRHRLRHGRLSPSRRRRSTMAAVRAAVRAAWHSRPPSRPRAVVRAAWLERSQTPQMTRRTQLPGSLCDRRTRRQPGRFMKRSPRCAHLWPRMHGSRAVSIK